MKTTMINSFLGICSHSSSITKWNHYESSLPNSSHIRQKKKKSSHSERLLWLSSSLLTQRFDSRDLTNYLSACLYVSSTLCLCNINLHHYHCRCGGWTNLPTTIWATLNIRPPLNLPVLTLFHPKQSPMSSSSVIMMQLHLITFTQKW